MNYMHVLVRVHVINKKNNEYGASELIAERSESGFP